MIYDENDVKGKWPFAIIIILAKNQIPRNALKCHSFVSHRTNKRVKLAYKSQVYKQYLVIWMEEWNSFCS